MKRTFASIVVAALILVLGAGTVFASAPRMVLSEPEYALQSSPPGDFLDYYDVENRLTTIGRAHVCDGMETKFVFSNDKGVSLEVKRKDTWPVPGGTTTIGWQLQKGSGTSASLTLSSAARARSKPISNITWSTGHMLSPSHLPRLMLWVSTVFRRVW